MKRALFEIVENKKLTQNVFEMKLVGDTSAIQAPGQFLNIALDGFYLRRPISVCDVNGDEVTIAIQSGRPGDSGYGGAQKRDA